jgi:hypothetical protein
MKQGRHLDADPDYLTYLASSLRVDLVARTVSIFRFKGATCRN